MGQSARTVAETEVSFSGAKLPCSPTASYINRTANPTPCPRDPSCDVRTESQSRNDRWAPNRPVAESIQVRQGMALTDGRAVHEFLAYPLILLIRFYKVMISPAYAPSCTFAPSCSTYGLQALRKHGPILGSIMTAERIMRNHQIDTLHYPIIMRDGLPYQWDPLEANDFWIRPTELLCPQESSVTLP